MHFPFLLAVLAALVIADYCPPEPSHGGIGWRLLLAAVGTALVILAAWAISLRAARQIGRRLEDRRIIQVRFARWRLAHTVLWLAMVGAIMLGLDWAQIVRCDWNLGRMVLADDLLILAPVIVPMVFSWGAFYRVDQAGARARAEEGLPTLGPSPSLGRYLSLHVRHFLGVMLLPVLCLLAVQDAVAIWFPWMLASWWSAAIYALPVALVAVFFPALLRRLWKTEVLESGPLRSRLTATAERAGFQVREILVWNTSGMVVNAAVSGWLPGKRYVFLTDGLISSLTAEEVEAVFGHELGHIRHRHLALRALVMLAPLSFLLAFDRMLPAFAAGIQTAFTGFHPAGQLPWVLAILAVLSSYAFFVFGGYCRLLEAEADLFGCGMIDRGNPGEGCRVFISALEKLAVANGSNRHRSGWQHPSVARRTEFLAEAAADPDRRRKFDRRIRMLNWFLIACTLAPVITALLR